MDFFKKGSTVRPVLAMSRSTATHCKLDELSRPLWEKSNFVLLTSELLAALSNQFCKLVRYLVGSSRNKMAGLSINSNPMASRLHSPPDKQETLVDWLFVNPKVFMISSICQKPTWNDENQNKVENYRHLQLTSFPFQRRHSLISGAQLTSCTPPPIN